MRGGGDRGGSRGRRIGPGLRGLFCKTRWTTRVAASRSDRTRHERGPARTVEPTTATLTPRVASTATGERHAAVQTADQCPGRMATGCRVQDRRAAPAERDDLATAGPAHTR